MLITLVWLAALTLSLPAWALLVLTLAAGRRRAPLQASVPTRPMRIAVLVPAHNESHHVLPTIACLLPQLARGDRVLVIADNCHDDTAELARRAGATVIERQHADLRGKGYALAFGVDHLRADPPDVVLVIDADCTLSEGGLRRVAQQALACGNPVQMINLMHANPGSGVRQRILEFAMVLKNLVRPLGSYRLGGACHLMGTGMALPWALMSTAKLATGHIAEDMKLGIDLALQGHPTHFSLEGEVSSAFPDDAQVARGQKARWEHGHLQTLTAELPRLVGALLRRPSAATAVLALDLLIPPLALYVLMLSAALALMGAACLFWPALLAPTLVLLAAAVALKVAVGLSWWRNGRQLLSARELFATPLYALWKLPVYVAYALRKRSAWVRTKRTSESSSGDGA